MRSALFCPAQTHLRQRNTADEEIEQEVIKYKERRRQRGGGGGADGGDEAEEDAEVREALRKARENRNSIDDDFGEISFRGARPIEWVQG